MKNIKRLTIRSAVAISILSSLSVHADPWTSFPGTKARGMGTAFVAIADDPSAAWHNPAGLYQLDGVHITIEGGNAPKYQTDDGGFVTFDNFNDPQTGETVDKFYASSWTDVEKGNNSGFISFNGGDGKEKGFSIYYFRPYFIESPAINKLTPKAEIFGHIEESVDILGFGYSHNIFTNEKQSWFHNLNLGLTLEYVSMDIEESELKFADGSDDITNLNLETVDAENGFSGSVGLLSTLYKGQDGAIFSPTIKFGGVYRFASSAKADDNEFNFTDIDGEDITFLTSDIFNGKPASWDAGLSSDMLIYSDNDTGIVSLALAGQYGKTKFDSVLTDMNYEKYALGAALRFSFADSNIRQIELRAGTYWQESDAYKNQLLGHYNDQQLSDGNLDNLFGLVYPDIDGITLGVQIAFSGGLVLEFANEKRDLKNAYQCVTLVDNNCDPTQRSKELSEDYWTIAVRYFWND